MERMRSFAQFLLVLVLGATFVPSKADAMQYPATSWEKVDSPEKAGWSSEKLRQAREYSATIGSSAVIIVYQGRVLDEWGEVAVRYKCHSIRKSFLSALYGIFRQEGKINLSSRLVELGVDDISPTLNEEEKQARIEDLLKSRSGVYHPAAAEIPAMAALRPTRGSHKPGEFWYYNNWDFNALGTIFEKLTNTTIGRAFKERIADPIQMQDFRAMDVEYSRIGASVHRASPVRMSARDMARFGLLYLRRGIWRDRQVIPQEWVEVSTKAHSLFGDQGVFGVYGGYGYLWWAAVDGKQFPGVDLKQGAFSAQGVGGHYIVVIPAYDLVIVHRTNTDRAAPADDVEEIAEKFGVLLNLILSARR
jgi:CubicO group peptidase (beta-lactamase class C family)